MAKVTASEFWEGYKEQVRDLHPTKALYHKDRAWTGITCQAAVSTLRALGAKRGNAAGIGCAVGQSLTQKEYFRLDLIGYDRLPGKHNWLLRVAFEHENSFKTWPDELCKLCHVVADIRVLASYHEFTTAAELVDKLQKEVTKMEKDSNRITRVPDVEWLFIFGPLTRNFSASLPFVAFTLAGTKVTPLPDLGPALNPVGWP